MRKSKILGTAAVLAIIAALTFTILAHADEVTDNNVGRETGTFYYNDANPAQGELDVSAWGIKYDSDGDDDNRADKHRAKALAVKKQAVRRIALGVKLQRRIDFRWVTVVTAAPINSGAAPSVTVFTPTRPFACGFNRYRSVAFGGARYNNNVFESFTQLSEEWTAYGRVDADGDPCPRTAESTD